MSGGFLAVQAKRTKERNKKVNLGCGSIDVRAGLAISTYFHVKMAKAVHD